MNVLVNVNVPEIKFNAFVYVHVYVYEHVHVSTHTTRILGSFFRFPRAHEGSPHVPVHHLLLAKNEREELLNGAAK